MALCGSSCHKTSASLSAWQHTVHDQAENLPSNRVATRGQKKIKKMRPKGRETKVSGGVRHGDSYKGIITDIDVIIYIYDI